MVVRLIREEHQRIAAKLRNAEIENLSTYEYSAHLGEAIGECVRLVSGHEILVRRGLDRLADLIEPEECTCQQVLIECNDGLMPSFTAYCSECGAQWGYTPNYCPKCGRKVICNVD